MEKYEYGVNTAAQRRTLILGVAALAFYLLMFREMPFEGWVLLFALLVVLPYRLVRGASKGACVRVDAEGVCDTRLGLGVVRWEDIERPYLRRTSGAPFICLQLKSPAPYRARMSAVQRLAAALYRMQGMKHVVIAASHLDADPETILERVREGCARTSRAA